MKKSREQILSDYVQQNQDKMKNLKTPEEIFAFLVEDGQLTQDSADYYLKECKETFCV